MRSKSKVSLAPVTLSIHFSEWGSLDGDAFVQRQCEKLAGPPRGPSGKAANGWPSGARKDGMTRHIGTLVTLGLGVFTWVVLAKEERFELDCFRDVVRQLAGVMELIVAEVKKSDEISVPSMNRSQSSKLSYCFCRVCRIQELSKVCDFGRLGRAARGLTTSNCMAQLLQVSCCRSQRTWSSRVKVRCPNQKTTSLTWLKGQEKTKCVGDRGRTYFLTFYLTRCSGDKYKAQNCATFVGMFKSPSIHQISQYSASTKESNPKSSATLWWVQRAYWPCRVERGGWWAYCVMSLCHMCYVLLQINQIWEPWLISNSFVSEDIFWTWWKARKLLETKLWDLWHWVEAKNEARSSLCVYLFEQCSRFEKSNENQDVCTWFWYPLTF